MKCNLEFDSLKRGLNIRGESEGWLLVGSLAPCEPNTHGQPGVKGRQLTAALYTIIRTTHMHSNTTYKSRQLQRNYEKY
jgi:hypothetical protein